MGSIALLAAAIGGFLAVALGAFGAHALSGRLDATELGWWQTAVQYQFWHSLALGGVAMGLLRTPRNRLLLGAMLALVLGILLFSGSLYLLALTGIRALVWLTPIGGSSWLLAWFLLGCYGWRLRQPQSESH